MLLKQSYLNRAGISGWESRFSPNRQAFTLIELLLVISIIIVLSGMLFTVLPGVSFKKKKAVAVAEMNEIVNAINAFKAQYNYFPADNPTVSSTNTDNAWLNPLFYELAGTAYAPGIPSGPLDTFTLLTMSPQVSGAQVSSGNISNAFGVTGFLNASQGSDANSPVAKTFLPPKPKRSALYSSGGVSNVFLLTCSVDPADRNTAGNNVTPKSAIAPGTSAMININPWNYISTAPTNNAQGFDLWVTIQSGSGPKARRSLISNWAKPLDY